MERLLLLAGILFLINPQSLIIVWKPTWNVLIGYSRGTTTKYSLPWYADTLSLLRYKMSSLQN